MIISWLISNTVFFVFRGVSINKNDKEENSFVVVVVDGGGQRSKVECDRSGHTNVIVRLRNVKTKQRGQCQFFLYEQTVWNSNSTEEGP